MHKIDKTITVKGNGNIFIPRRIIKDEYPKPKTNEGENNNTVLGGILGLYPPDGYYYVRKVGEPGNSTDEYIFVESLTEEQVRSSRDIFYALYKDNTLDPNKCIQAIVRYSAPVFAAGIDADYKPLLYTYPYGQFVESPIEGYYRVKNSLN